MRPTDSFLHRPIFTSLDDLKRSLATEGAETLLHLTDVLLIPPDMPRLPIVLVAVCKAIEAYGTTLKSPNALFRLVLSVVDELRVDITNRLAWTASTQELSQPLLRRLLAHAPYATFLSVGTLPNDQATRYWKALGAEIASCLATGKVFSRAFANDLRREMTPQLFGHTGFFSTPAPWEKSATKKLRLAAKLFEADSSPDPDDTSPLLLFDIKAGYELSRKLRYSPPRQRQALLDRHHQSQWQFQCSAAQLLARAQTGDQTALLTLIAFLAGLSLATVIGMPICTSLASDNSVMGLNLSDGTILTNVGRLAHSSANPSPNATVFRTASWISEKPLPAVLLQLLRHIADRHPNASTLGELLPEASTSGRQLTVIDDHSALKATTARFLSSAGPIAVALGIDRLSAALTSNDFAVIPGSKLYYALARRESIWVSANRLFEALGWGPAVPFVPGPPVGSHSNFVEQLGVLADFRDRTVKYIHTDRFIMR